MKFFNELSSDSSDRLFGSLRSIIDGSVLSGAIYLVIGPMLWGVPNHHFVQLSLDAPNDVMCQFECRRREA